MQANTIKSVFIVAALLLSIGSSVCAEQKPAAVSATTSATKSVDPGHKQAQNQVASVRKIRLVDINSAGPNELKTLPGVTDVVAEQIIAGRPFGSKSQLNTRGILPRDVYENLKGLVIAKQDAMTTAKLLSK